MISDLLWVAQSQTSSFEKWDPFFVSGMTPNIRDLKSQGSEKKSLLVVLQKKNSAEKDRMERIRQKGKYKTERKEYTSLCSHFHCHY